MPKSTRSRRPFALSLSSCVAAVTGWILAQLLPHRITEAGQFTEAYVHATATSTFAVVFGLSALWSAIIIGRHYRDSPQSYSLRLPGWQIALLCAVFVWVAAIAVGQVVFAVEVVAGAAIAICSVGVFACAVRVDEASQLRRKERLLTASIRRTPHARRVLRGVQLIAPLAGVLLLAGTFAAAQLTTVEHHDCWITGGGNFNGDAVIFSENCGPFSVDEERVPQGQIDALLGATDVTIVTRGFEFGFPPRPVAVELHR